MRILYLEGDAASPKYVGGALRHLGLAFELSARPPPGTPRGHDMYIVSDLPADRLSQAAMRGIVDEVRRGAGLLMVGGWQSFGRGGYASTPLAEILPVTMRDGDDRRAVPSGAWLAPSVGHAITGGLPWHEPPVVTGWNAVEARADAQVLVEGRPLEPSVRGPRLADERAPILVVAEVGEGRAAALATDLAPHWSGGWTDWGAPSYDVGEGEELGAAYIDFLGRLCRWLARRDGARTTAEPARATP